MGKIKTLPALKRVVRRLKEENKTIVFTNGCFDIFHPGHVKILTEAKKKGDVLIVGLNSDTSVKKIKGEKRPVLEEGARAQLLAAVEAVDYIVLFHEDTPYTLIRKIEPDYLVKGGDWSPRQIVGREFVRKVFRVKLAPDYSTTRIIERIKKSC